MPESLNARGMSYCLNPTCQEPQNLDGAECCRACGFRLQLHDRYRAVRLLGQGGFGRTFLAIDEGEGRRQEAEGGRQKEEGKRQKEGQEAAGSQFVSDGLQAASADSLCVIKQFLPRQTGAVELEAIALFQKEAQRLQELGEHPQIPTLLDFFQDQQLYLVQEYIDGQTLEQVLATQGAFKEAAIWQLLDQMLPVLKFMHDRQVIHRDIKPANLIWQQDRESSRLVLVDFGAAKLVQLGDRLQTGTSIGSAEYVAPEQARGKAVFASDLYSLGVTCIHLLTDVSPFDLFDSVHDGWFWRQSVTNSVSDRLAAILDRLLQNALSKRFQSADEVMQAIEHSAVSDQPSASTQNSKLKTQNSPPIASWYCVHTLIGHTACVNAVAICPNRPLLASSSEDKTIRFWELQTGDVTTADLDQVQAVRAIAFSPDGETLASAGQDRNVVLTRSYLDVAGRSEILGQHMQAVTAIAFTANGQLLASASRDKTIKLWDLQSRQELCTLKAHRLNITAIAFSPDGHLASASADRTACLWSIEANFAIQMRYTFTDHVGTVQAVAFSLDGQLLATGGDDRTIKLWSTQTGCLLRTLAGHSWTVSALQFTPDSSTLISGSWDGTLKLWDLTDRQAPPIVLPGHSDSINTIALSADGKTLISGSSDRTIRVWQVIDGSSSSGERSSVARINL